MFANWPAGSPQPAGMFGPDPTVAQMASAMTYANRSLMIMTAQLVLGTQWQSSEERQRER